MTKILSVLNSNFSYTLQECYEEFINTSKVKLLNNREILGDAFEKIYKNLNSLYQKDEHFIEFFAQIYYKVNCKFEFKYFYDFLREQNHKNEWLEFANNVFNEPLAFYTHFTNLVNLYNNQYISDINEEFIYLYLKYLEKCNIHNRYIWQQYNEKSYLSDYLIQSLQNLPNDYIASRNMLLDEFDKYNDLENVVGNMAFSMEVNSNYANDLKRIKEIDFDRILSYCKKVYKLNGCDLERGKKILQTQDELTCYLGAYGLMHQIKLNESFKTLCSQINLSNLTLNIIDYGCGQALASCVFLDFIKKQNLNTKIAQIILIDPSNIALSRGILHLELLGITQQQIKVFNKSLDEINTNDLMTMDQNITIHIFSNILDLTNFRLDRYFYDKISSANKGKNIFICVSPPYNNTQLRLDLFYQHFRKNYNAYLIVHNKDSIIHNDFNRDIKRYEYVFTCNF